MNEGDAFLHEWRKERFIGWIQETVSDWICERGAWDHYLDDPDDDFDEEDWEWIRDNLKIESIKVEEVK